MPEPTDTPDGAVPTGAESARAFAEWFRRRLREKLAARGLAGAELERAVEDLMMRDIGFRFDPDGIERE
jgi:hypothetical protein